MNAHRMANIAGQQQASAMRRLASGLRINSAADDAAGLAISEGMRAQIRGMQQAERNAQNGISLLQTAEGFVTTLGELTHRINDLVVTAASDTYGTEDRQRIFNEIDQMMLEMERIFERSTFNGQNLFQEDGRFDGRINLQVGANSADVIGINLGGRVGDLREMLGDFRTAVEEAFETGTHESINSLLGPDGMISQMQNSVSNLRSGMGAYINRLEFTIENLGVSIENLSSAESRIRDADMAAEMMRLVQANILRDMAMMMMAQAMQSPNMILRLLEGVGRNG
jgi:flagellin